MKIPEQFVRFAFKRYLPDRYSCGRFMTFDESFEAISHLVAGFAKYETRYLSPAYQESEVRADFIDKLFTALGWDVGHVKQQNPYQQEVKVEKHPDGCSQRRADYAFYLAPNYRDVRFFVEAKKPSRNLFNADDYFQAIRYAWNAGTPLVVLTDFEEFHILDARARPVLAGILDRKIKTFHYTDYNNPERLREIYHLFSHEAVAEGALESYAEKLPKQKSTGKQTTLFPGSQTIDEAFLSELDDIRLRLAKAFKKRNPSWDGELLTEAVQRCIDRLVFMRFLEDRLIEPERIVSELGNTKSIWRDFSKTCRTLGARYNGVVFKAHFIDSTDCAGPDETAFKDVCDSLSHENSPYDFNTIPIHILGSVYERFLGKVIRVTPKRADVEDRPEVKRAGGVTYTPQFIVRHIVERTVGRLLDGKSPKQIAGLRFVDIACGSGSFLLTVFEHLLDYHREWYHHHPENAKRDGCAWVDGVWALTLRQKQSILVNNVFGVDVDPQAVEITQLSLYLKLLEDETTATANEMQVLFKEKMLPDLSRNIVAGNSIISTDILDGNLFSGEEERAVFPLDFETMFPLVMRNGGFDAVVGNPPYVRQETLGSKVKSYLRSHYSVAHGTADLYTYFIERGMNILKPGGRFGYIVANKWLRAAYGLPLRRWLKQQHIEEISDFGDLPVFRTVTTYPCLLFMRKDKPSDEFRATIIETLNFERLDLYIEEKSFTVSQPMLEDDGWTLTDENTQKLLRRIRSVGIPLGKYVNGKIYYGIKTGLNEAFVIDSETRDRLIADDPASAEIIKPFLAGRDIKRYEPLKPDKWLILIPNGWTRKHSHGARSKEIWFRDRLPSVYLHLKQYEQAARQRYDQGEYWWELRACDYYDEFEKPKIVLAEIATRGQFSIDSDSLFYDTTGYIISACDSYLLAILNSSLTTFVFRSISSEIRGGFLRWKRQYTELLPVLADPPTSVKNKIISLVDSMVETRRCLQSSVTDRDKTFYRNKCESIDRQIDELVWELYGVKEKERPL